MTTPFYSATVVPRRACHLPYQPSLMVQGGTSEGMPHVDQDILSLVNDQDVK